MDSSSFGVLPSLEASSSGSHATILSSLNEFGAESSDSKTVSSPSTLVSDDDQYDGLDGFLTPIQTVTSDCEGPPPVQTSYEGKGKNRADTDQPFDSTTIREASTFLNPSRHRKIESSQMSDTKSGKLPAVEQPPPKELSSTIPKTIRKTRKKPQKAVSEPSTSAAPSNPTNTRTIATPRASSSRAPRRRRAKRRARFVVDDDDDEDDDEEEENFDILSLVPNNVIPCISYGVLAFRDGTIDPKRGKLRRGHIYHLVR